MDTCCSGVQIFLHLFTFLLCICANLSLMQNWCSVHLFLPQFFHHSLLGIISSYKTPAARNVTESVSASITLPPLLSFFVSFLCNCCTHRIGFPSVDWCHWRQQNGNRRLQRRTHPVVGANRHSILPGTSYQYGCTTTRAGHLAVPVIGYLWIDWTTYYYRPTTGEL